MGSSARQLVWVSLASLWVRRTLCIGLVDGNNRPDVYFKVTVASDAVDALADCFSGAVRWSTGGRRRGCQRISVGVVECPE